MNLNDVEDRARLQKKAEWWRTWGTPQFKFNPDKDIRNGYKPSNFAVDQKG